MANAHVLISSQTLGSTTSAVTFNSIPGTYRDLRIVSVSQINANSSITYIYNNDTGANYASVDMRGWSGGANSFSVGSRNYNDTAYNNYDANTLIQLGIDIFDYCQTDKHKPSLVRSNGTNSGTGMTIAFANRWASTSAVTRVDVTATGGAFAVGSTFYLYGVLG
jgi:hypothetical protein